MFLPAPPLADARLPAFTTACGAVTGRDHARANRNAQDACAVRATPRAITLAVADGCSSGTASEVGAALGVAWLVRNAADCAEACAAQSPDALASAIGTALLAYLRTVADALAPPVAAVVNDFFLFSFLAAVITERSALVFGAGDGVIAVNGATTVLDPGPDNAPDYLAYGLLGPRAWPVRVHHASASHAIDTIVLATDGAIELIERKDEAIDGTAQGGLAQFTGERYARNPSLLRKRLAVIGALHGRLHDDTAIAVLARSAARDARTP